MAHYSIELQPRRFYGLEKFNQISSSAAAAAAAELVFLTELIADLTASSLEEGKRKGTRHFLSASPVSLKNELGPAARGFHHCYIQ